MKQEFSYTEDSSFKSVKNEMHMSVTEHIIKEEETQKLYHYVVSYGSLFHISSDSIFMSHLFDKIGITGYCKAYSAEGCKIKLPWYPSSGLESKSIVELPEGFCVEQISFDKSKNDYCEEFKKTFLAQKFKAKTSTKEQVDYSAEYLVKELFGCTSFKCGVLQSGDEYYPIYCVLSNFAWHTKKDMIDILQKSDICKNAEIRAVLKKFIKLDISKMAREFKQETQNDTKCLVRELKERQAILRTYLLFKQPTKKSEELEI